MPFNFNNLHFLLILLKRVRLKIQTLIDNVKKLMIINPLINSFTIVFISVLKEFFNFL